MLLPCIGYGLRYVHGVDNGGKKPWNYIYTLLIYLACIPGMFSAVITAYTLFFSRENLLDSNAVIYFFPIITMLMTLMAIRQNISFDAIPGFDRIYGLMILLAITFIIVLFVAKVRIFIGFVGSMTTLLVIAVVVFALLKKASEKIFKR